MKVDKLRKEVEFHLGKGIVQSDLTRAQLSISYDLQSNGSFVDDFKGGAVLNRVKAPQMPPRLYDYEWRLMLADGRYTSQSKGQTKPP